MAMAQSGSGSKWLTFRDSFSRGACNVHPENSAALQLNKSIQTPNYSSTHHLRSVPPPLLPRKTQAAAHFQCAQSGPEVAQGGCRWLEVAPGGLSALPFASPSRNRAFAVSSSQTNPSPSCALFPLSHWLLPLIAWNLELGIWKFHLAPPLKYAERTQRYHSRLFPILPDFHQTPNRSAPFNWAMGNRQWAIAPSQQHQPPKQTHSKPPNSAEKTHSRFKIATFVQRHPTRPAKQSQTSISLANRFFKRQTVTPTAVATLSHFSDDPAHVPAHFNSASRNSPPPSQLPLHPAPARLPARSFRPVRPQQLPRQPL